MKRPNILLITTDQQRYDTIAALGYDYMVTPNLDELASEGCCYTQCYSPNPVCMAARHNIITGLPARHHGFDDNYFDNNPRTIPYDRPTFPQILSDAKYDTIAIGKMHFQPYRRHNGFNRMELMEEIPRYLQEDDYALYLAENGFEQIQSIHGVRHLLYMEPQRSLVGEKHHGTTWVADRTIHHLKENGGKRPFFIWSSFIEPHPPLDVPDEWADLYKGKELPKLKESVTPISALAEENKCIGDYPTEAYLRRVRELYFAAISFVDHNVGRIISQLKEMGEYDNTLIVFTSDHGEMLGDYGTFQKFLPYDSAARIPCIVRYPKFTKPGSICRDFADLNDLLPTFLDVAGLVYPHPEILPGESLFAVDKKKDRTVQYIEHTHGNRRWVSLRDKKYKYNYYYGGGREELFDMEKDPDETVNLLHDSPAPELLEVKERLKNRLIEMESRYGLEGYVTDGQFVVMDDYQPIFYRENNPPRFPGKENKEYIGWEEEVKRAIAKEDVVHLEELDVDYFTERGTVSREKLFGTDADHTARGK